MRGPSVGRVLSLIGGTGRVGISSGRLPPRAELAQASRACVACVSDHNPLAAPCPLLLINPLTNKMRRAAIALLMALIISTAECWDPGDAVGGEKTSSPNRASRWPGSAPFWLRCGSLPP